MKLQKYISNSEFTKRSLNH